MFLSVQSTGEDAGESEVLLLLPREGDMALGIEDAVEENKTKERPYDSAEYKGGNHQSNL